MYSWLFLSIHLVVMLLALVHALVYKRDHRAALGWIGIIIVFPVAGPLLYFVFGINRIRSVARRFSGHHLPFLSFGYERAERPKSARHTLPDSQDPVLFSIGGRVTGAAITRDNRVEILLNGEQFFPRLIATIDEASDCVLLSSYLFSDKGIAAEVIDCLTRAVNRGVRVYVLVDGTGILYSFRAALRPLRQAGVRVAEFIPLSLLPPSFSINLRNHRKIVVVDGQCGFYGGINIDHRHMVEDINNRHTTEDVHFMARGPMVSDLQSIFVSDWWMATREKLSDLPEPGAGESRVHCRVIDDGPAESLDALAMTLLGIFAAAERQITIMTPYFLPSREIIAALQAAALRGVQVNILLPARSNLRFIDWATRNLLWELLIWDMAVYYKPAPFAHSKLITIDDCYVMGGSANIDPRSLRLNFELGVEMLDRELATRVKQHIDSAIAGSRRLSLSELDRRPIWQRIRDAIFWLFSSYL